MRLLPHCRFFLGIILALVLLTDLRSENIVFPKDARIVDVVADYGARGDGKSDDTQAIQKALDDHPAQGAIIYLRNGTYRISDTLNWPRGDGAGELMKDTILQGQSEAGTILLLTENAPGFGDPENPKNMIYTGGPPAQRFRNSIRNLTIDSGGNAGAIGAAYCANNQGALRNVTFRSGADGKAPGFVGLDMSVNEVGPQLVSDLTVIGFETGVRTGAGVNSITLERITLRGQRKVGYHNRDNYSFIRGLKSDNSVPALINSGPAAVALIVDAELTGTGEAENSAAVINETPTGLLFVRNLETRGYRQAIQPALGEAVPSGKVTEWVSLPPVVLFPGTQTTTLDLPVKETPTVPWDPPESWASPDQFGGSPDDDQDDTAAIQSAIDSGATTIFLKRGINRKRGYNEHGAYFISDTIHIRGKVRRIIGLEAMLMTTRAFGEKKGKPVFEVGKDAQPVVVFERISFSRLVKFKQPAFLLNADKSLVLSSCSDLRFVKVERGDLFLEDTVGNGWEVGPGGRLWGRQLNLEGPEMKLVNDGGQVWILGLKTEARGPILETRNGGVTEILGAHLYTCVDGGQDAGTFFVKDSKFVVAAGAEYVWNRKWATTELLRETRGNENRRLQQCPLRPPAQFFEKGTTTRVFISKAAEILPAGCIQEEARVVR